MNGNDDQGEQNRRSRWIETTIKVSGNDDQSEWKWRPRWMELSIKVSRNDDGDSKWPCGWMKMGRKANGVTIKVLFVVRRVHVHAGWVALRQRAVCGPGLFVWRLQRLSRRKWRASPELPQQLKRAISCVTCSGFLKLKAALHHRIYDKTRTKLKFLNLITHQETSIWQPLYNITSNKYENNKWIIVRYIYIIPLNMKNRHTK